MKDWNAYNFKNDNFWKIFFDNFENYTVENFEIVNKNNLRLLRSYFKKRNIWMQIDSKISVNKTLTNILEKTKSTEWTKKKVRSC